jgi:hypothetical protein
MTKNLNRENIKKFLNIEYKDKDLSNISRWLKEKYNNIYQSIIKNTSYLSDNCTFSERIYHIIHNIREPVLCKTCKKGKVNFKTFYYGYYDYCSSKCGGLNIEVQKKKRKAYRSQFSINMTEILNSLDLKLEDDVYENAHFKHNWRCLKCSQLPLG